MCPTCDILWLTQKLSDKVKLLKTYLKDDRNTLEIMVMVISTSYVPDTIPGLFYILNHLLSNSRK